MVSLWAARPALRWPGGGRGELHAYGPVFEVAGQTLLFGDCRCQGYLGSAFRPGGLAMSGWRAGVAFRRSGDVASGCRTSSAYQADVLIGWVSSAFYVIRFCLSGRRAGVVSSTVLLLRTECREIRRVVAAGDSDFMSRLPSRRQALLFQHRGTSGNVGRDLTAIPAMQPALRCTFATMIYW